MQLNLLLNAISREKPVHFVQMSNPKREIGSTRMLLDDDLVQRTICCISAITRTIKS